MTTLVVELLFDGISYIYIFFVMKNIVTKRVMLELQLFVIRCGDERFTNV